MLAEIISIGDEITSGRILDTNSQWLSQQLEDLGSRVLYHTAVGDDLEAIAAVFRTAIERSDVAVSTGGLGPTADDLTREALALAVGRPLVTDAEALRHIESIFARRNRPMPPQNKRQALLPEGGTMLANPNGTAPGILLRIERLHRAPCMLVALPGVPAEMKEMWQQSTVALVAAARQEVTYVLRRDIKCFGAGESNIESMIPDLLRRDREPLVGINASQGTIILRIRAQGTDCAQCQEALEATEKAICNRLGPLVFGRDNDELEAVALNLLQQHRKTLAVIECATEGLVSQWLCTAPHAEAAFCGGLVVENVALLERLLASLGYPAACSPEDRPCLAAAMATAARRWFGADWGLAVGPVTRSPSASEQPPEVCLALDKGDGPKRKPVTYAGHPAIVKTVCAKHALNWVRLELLDPSSK